MRNNTPCTCAHCKLGEEEDFKNQTSAMEQYFETYNSENGTKHVCIFLPTFHPDAGQR